MRGARRLLKNPLWQNVSQGTTLVAPLSSLIASQASAALIFGGARNADRKDRDKAGAAFALYARRMLPSVN